MCSACILEHCEQQPDHITHCLHITKIKLLLDNIIDNIGESSSNNENTESEFIKSTKSIWKSLKASTSRYQSLSAKENEIKQYFEQLHQYLVIEEHKLKKDIINDKDKIINQIDNSLNNLKYLVNIININNKLNCSSDDNNDNDSADNGYDSQSIIEDTTDLYSITTIMQSITTSLSLQSFILDNNQTLFKYDKNNNYFNIDELLKQHHNDSSSLLLDIIHKYNNQYNKTTEVTDSNKNHSTYELSIKQFDFNQLNSMINQTIKIDKIETSIQSTSPTKANKNDISAQSSPIKTITTTNNNENKSSYIFTTHILKGATLIDISNNNSIEQFNFDYDFYCTYQSIISIGEHIYIFGGMKNSNKWMKFSIRSKSVEYIGKMEGIDGDFGISVCYDGQDHIYLVNGFGTNRIDRFNITTMQFERYHKLPEDYGHSLISTMIFKGLLYAISYDKNLVFQFDLTSKTIKNHHQIDIKAHTACHDNNGNFYIYDNIIRRFIKYNVENQKTIKLSTIPAKQGDVYLMYHRESSTSSYIYSFGGVNKREKSTNKREKSTNKREKSTNPYKTTGVNKSRNSITYSLKTGTCGRPTPIHSLTPRTFQVVTRFDWTIEDAYQLVRRKDNITTLASLVFNQIWKFYCKSYFGGTPLHENNLLSDESIINEYVQHISVKKLIINISITINLQIMEKFLIVHYVRSQDNWSLVESKDVQQKSEKQDRIKIYIVYVYLIKLFHEKIHRVFGSKKVSFHITIMNSYEILSSNSKHIKFLNLMTSEMYCTVVEYTKIS
ncbi:hypothetical protein PPL_08271 [Heterostelium album PN500]|uniref:Uncharacterized protein n=1 Tax=Heterostelium pallidum (strain ATCC 26659 / Pp 5 / PN500) TaxID=670386 RepID=D3BHQ8_HETP5|nr:hypothetical protein PPL_08271 [Heterostelium album PN500]EFA78808.1 hypothetical protein PPL_08271 [Heterostelium album PN500]|eukprot:XP_020430932.1 hypothetical protein PPL_08271 [Heterostelium album PN500]